LTLGYIEGKNDENDLENDTNKKQFSIIKEKGKNSHLNKKKDSEDL